MPASEPEYRLIKQRPSHKRHHSHVRNHRDDSDENMYSSREPIIQDFLNSRLFKRNAANQMILDNYRQNGLQPSIVSQSNNFSSNPKFKSTKQFLHSQTPLQTRSLVVENVDTNTRPSRDGQRIALVNHDLLPDCRAGPNSRPAATLEATALRKSSDYRQTPVTNNVKQDLYNLYQQKL